MEDYMNDEEDDEHVSNNETSDIKEENMYSASYRSDN